MTEAQPKAVPYSKEQHAAQVDSYKQYEGIPMAILEHQLHESALGNCEGFSVLDIGGGQGLRARHAIEHGAAAVDVIDLSPEMMRVGQQIEESLGRGGSVVQWFEADVSQPDEVARLPLRYGARGYDMVMANWIFDHCSSPEMLNGMFRSAVAHLKPGGRFVGTRVFNDPRASAATTSAGRYGAEFKDFVEIPGGMAYRYVLHVDPPVAYDAASMESTYDPAQVDAYHSRYGLENTQVEAWEKTSCVKSDPDFWKTFLDAPIFAVVTATKKVT